MTGVRPPTNDWLPALLLLALLLTGSGAAALWPVAGQPVALLFPPWWEAGRLGRAAATAGRIVRLGRWTNIVVVRPDEGRPFPYGAWLALNPIVAGGCGDAG